MSVALSRRLVVVAIALGGLARCNSPPVTLYTLVARPGTPIARPIGPLALRPVQIPKYLDQPEIVRRRSPVVMQAADYERWAEGLDDMTTRVLLEDLALRLPGAQLTATGGAVTPDNFAGTTIAVEIARFDPDPDGSVLLEARWTIRRGDAPAAIHLERIETHAPDTKAADVVDAMSDALAQLADRIVLAL